MDAGKYAEKRAANQHPVEMADDEVRFGNLKIEWRTSEHDSRQSTEDEHR